MKDILTKTAGFFKVHGHRIFTFIVGLAFIAAVCFGIAKLSLGVYRIFVPNDIYTDSGYAAMIYGGSPFDNFTAENGTEPTNEFFESYLANFVMQDIPNFDEPSQLGDEYVISFGIWQALSLNNSQGVYKYNSKGSFRVPAKDVEMYINYYLDYPRKIKHRTVDICGKFKYNSLNKTYTVPATNVDSYLLPDVLSVEAGENDTYVVTADLYEGNPMSAEAVENDPQNFRRRISVTLQNMGIQNYNAETGAPVPRYMVLSCRTLDETMQQNESADVELN